MALLFLDGFDHYATADVTKKWTSQSNTTIDASNGRRSGGALAGNIGASSNVIKTLSSASASFVVGAAIKLGAAVTLAIDLFRLFDAGTLQCGVKINPDLTLSVHRNNTVLTSGTSVTSLSVGTWAYIEFKVTIADSIGAGSCKVRINGVDVITVATSQDTKNSSNASANQVSIGGGSGGGAAGTLIDDFYICDQSGGSNNDFLGDCRIDTLFPNADGSNSDFTPSTGSTHYTLVDEATPNTSDYVESSTVSHKDTWAFQNLSAITGTIYGVQVCSAALKDDAGARSIANTVKSSATNADGATQALSTSQVYYMDVWATDPNTAAAWTESAVNSAEFGVKVAA